MLRIVNRLVVRSNLSKSPKNVNGRLYSTSEKVVNGYKSALISSTAIGIGSYLLFKGQSGQNFLSQSNAQLPFFLEHLIEASCEKRADKKLISKRHEIIRDDLPCYTDEELALHDNKYRIINYPGVDTSSFDVIGNACEVQR
jgi:hypothetical protein